MSSNMGSVLDPKTKQYSVFTAALNGIMCGIRYPISEHCYIYNTKSHQFCTDVVNKVYQTTMQYDNTQWVANK